jgi:hypothetical protein
VQSILHAISDVPNFVNMRPRALEPALKKMKILLSLLVLQCAIASAAKPARPATASYPLFGA